MDTTTEANIAGLQSQINGWVIEIQNIQILINDMEKKIKEIRETTTK